MDAAKSMGEKTKVGKKIQSQTIYDLKHKLRKLDFTIQHGEDFKQESIVITAVFWKS